MTPPERSGPGAADEELKAIGAYEIVREIGQRGGMGAVYEARHKTSGRIDAVKTIMPAVFASDSIVGRFLREVSILRRLRHPRYVQYRDFGHDQGRLYLAMEYVWGVNATKMRKFNRAGGKLPIPLAMKSFARCSTPWPMPTGKGSSTGTSSRVTFSPPAATANWSSNSPTSAWAGSIRIRP